MTKIIKKEEIPYPFLEKPLKLFTFENGFKVVFAYKDSPMINISSWVKTGSINENNENNGVSHFVEHLLFKGTTKFPAGVFDKTMERLGGIINAATWKDYTFFYINIPKEHSKIALEIQTLSIGSVPEPSSSNRTREFLSQLSKISDMFLIWAE